MQVSPRTGVATIGAVPFIINYNVPLETSDLQAAKAIAKAVSERGGGLRGVEVSSRPGDLLWIRAAISWRLSSLVRLCVVFHAAGHGAQP